ncbi:hypothetical protein BGW36DRAFT_434157 [Talaromyces proteolyticus]|uniref:Homologous-pairing protein 2 winged helix domain-containing protein n=1 Tax=Talaromyces proteolyticus TaxID=1131652 RepID=A0AAD4KD64_9EURO|nr:uncharacterized protein BGW36DRAFT_434157 [Talaromyces proteolyticus]KAH8688869.1 hypothetical protein BGW36DRAFT_434157 [Talaromyces proteolyticus]
MAPRKKKSDKDESDGSTLILEYLKKEKVTAYAVKALKELHERKEIEGRAAGKQLVYHALQDVTENTMDVDPAREGETLEDLEEKVSALKTLEKQLREKLVDLNSNIPITSLRDQIASLEREKASLLSAISSLPTDCVSAEEMDRVQVEWLKWQRQSMSRRKIFRDLWSRCTEVLPQDTTEEELKESLGLEGPF